MGEIGSNDRFDDGRKTGHVELLRVNDRNVKVLKGPQVD